MAIVILLIIFGINHNFFDLGGHSPIALQLFAQIERIWKKHILFSVLLESPTIGTLADTLRQSRSTTWSPLVLLKSGRNKPPLFCIHPIGGNLFEYYNLVTKLDLERPIYGLQAQGLDREKQPLDRIEDMASNFIRSIQTIQPHGSYFLVGYSFGGTIAFEIARQLTARGQKVAWLGLLDIRSPTLKQIKLPFLQRLSIHANRLQQFRLQQQIDYFIDIVLYRKKWSIEVSRSLNYSISTC